MIAKKEEEIRSFMASLEDLPDEESARLVNEWRAAVKQLPMAERFEALRTAQMILDEKKDQAERESAFGQVGLAALVGVALYRLHEAGLLHDKDGLWSKVNAAIKSEDGDALIQIVEDVESKVNSEVAI